MQGIFYALGYLGHSFNKCNSSKNIQNQPKFDGNDCLS